LENFVSRAAIALENAHLHKQLEWAAALEERQRIAADMHDGLAQTLSILGLKTDQAAEFMSAGLEEQVLDELQEIRHTVNEASLDVRRSITSLHESPRPRQSLQDCLAGIVDEFAVQGGPDVELTTPIKAPLYLPPEQLEQVQRVIREGLSNACRHAQARQITVGLEANGQEFTIILEDDGRGFDPDAPPIYDDDGHFGLSIMRARAARVGGRIKIDSAPGQGARVTLTWPRKNGAADVAPMMAQAQLDQSFSTLTTVRPGEEKNDKDSRLVGG